MNRRTVLIGLDAAEPRLIEQWMAEGDLPNLAKIKKHGAYGRLRSSAEWLAGSPWPTFYTGTTPGDHGRYHVLQWDSERMAHRRTGPEWLPERPFWRDPHFGDRRVVAVDLPSTYLPEPFNGIEISGWSTHDRLYAPASHPPETIRWVRDEFGDAPVPDEVYGFETARSLLQQRDGLIEATHHLARMGARLMELEQWDLFMIGFGAPHRGGHKLWDGTGMRGAASEDQQRALSGALREVYMACDAAVGTLADAAGDEATLAVVSLHGMGPNSSRLPILPEMLNRVLTGHTRSTTTSMGLLKRLRSTVPVEWRNEVKRRLPTALQDKLTSFWRIGDVDLSNTRALSLVTDHQGYLRINLKGREAGGLVEPGDAYDSLCSEIETGLKTFRDADTGAPFVEQVIRTDRAYPSAPRLNRLPDLLVLWTPSPACRHRLVTSPVYGEIDWPTPGLTPDGRSGNHRGEGFLLARGARILPSSIIEGGDILDLAPTLSALLDVDPKPEWSGRSLFH